MAGIIWGNGIWLKQIPMQPGIRGLPIPKDFPSSHQWLRIHQGSPPLHPKRLCQVDGSYIDKFSI